MEINLTGEPIGQDRSALDANHLCWIYENDSDKVGVIKPYMLTHLVRGHKCILVVPAATASEVLDACRKDDIEVDRYMDSGQLAVMEPEDMFFAGGPFDVDAILHRLRSAWTQAKADGWERLAVVSDPSALLERADERDWLALEFRVDFECMTEPCSTLCIYDARQASGSFIAQVIKVHPVIGLGRGLARNPFYGRPGTAEVPQ